MLKGISKIIQIIKDREKPEMNMPAQDNDVQKR
jgi:hypothetical protein